MSVRRSLATLVSGSIGMIIIQFAVSIAMARLVTPDELGVHAAAIAMTYLVNAVLNVGVRSYVVREKDLGPAKLGSVVSVTLLQSLVFGGGLFIAGPFVGEATRDARVGEAVQILAIFGALWPVYILLSALAHRDMRFGPATGQAFVNVIVSSAVAIPLAIVGYSWKAAPIGAVAGAAAAVLAGLAINRRALSHMRPSLRHARPILKTGSFIMSAAVLLNVTQRLPYLILTREAGTAATSLYDRGATLVDMVGASFVNAIQNVTASQMARDRHAGHGIHHIYSRMSRVVTGVLWPGYAVAAVLAAPIIGFIYGEKWLPAAPVLSIIAVAAIIQSTVLSRNEVLVTVGRERDLPRNEALRGVAGVSLFYIGAQYGLVWAALSRIADAVIAVALYSPQIHRATQQSWAQMARPFARSGVVAVATAAPAALLMSLEGWPQMLNVFELGALAVLSAAAWLGSLRLVRHDLWAEIARLARPLAARLRRA